DHGGGAGRGGAGRHRARAAPPRRGDGGGEGRGRRGSGRSRRSACARCRERATTDRAGAAGGRGRRARNRSPRARPRGPVRASHATGRRAGVMRPFVALLLKELRAYFGGPLVYLVAAAFFAYTGYYFHSDLVYFLTFGFGANIMENFWQLLFMDIRLVVIFGVPLLTMRLLAEERRLGTLELLLTYPLRDGAIVAAKLGACLVVVGMLIGGTALYPMWIYRVQPFALSPLIAAYAGLFL